ncbi:aldehyde dehydrogenase family protein [Streptomyces sp. SD31]|uniref:aldehyde dehydrogenase family protein n=1 Tax=Streptomyces sp. SD31 TaxID=3452208 RepID=UPI003F8B1B20
MESNGQQFLAGKRRSGTSGEQYEVTNPATGEVLATDTPAGPQDVHETVAAARAAFVEWSRTTPAERSEALLRWADRLQARSEELARTESRNAGKPIRLTRGEEAVAFGVGSASGGGARRQRQPDQVRRNPASSCSTLSIACPCQ